MADDDEEDAAENPAPQGDPLMISDERLRPGFSARAEATRRRLEPFTGRVRAAFTEENARSIARKAKTVAQSEQAARAAKVVGGVVLSAMVSKHLKAGGVAQSAVSAVANAAGLTSDTTKLPSQHPTGTPPAAADEVSTAWQPPRPATAAQRRYPTQPGLLHLGFSGSGQLFKHPDLPDLWVESALYGFNDPVVEFEWKPGNARRSHMRGPDVSESWAQVECTGQMLPLELRRVTDTDIEFRWLEPTAEQRSVTTLWQPPLIDGDVAARRAKIALDATHRLPRWH